MQATILQLWQLLYNASRSEQTHRSSVSRSVRVVPVSFKNDSSTTRKLSRMSSRNHSNGDTERITVNFWSSSLNSWEVWMLFHKSPLNLCLTLNVHSRPLQLVSRAPDRNQWPSTVADSHLDQRSCQGRNPQRNPAQVFLLRIFWHAPFCCLCLLPMQQNW